MAKIITMGELLVRLSTINNEKLIQAQQLDVCYGGSEANVAVSLALMGHEVTYLTKLPDNPLGHSAAAFLRKYGVDTSKIAFGGDRMGIYYLEPGSSLRPSKVVYDRAGSSMSRATSEDFDFESIFEGADWLHFSGITPALSEESQVLTLEAVKAAQKAGLTVSCDLNFRNKLWTREQAQQVMPKYMEYVDVCLGGREDAVKVLGFSLSKRNEDDTPNPEAYRQLFEDMTSKHNFKYVAFSIRQSHTTSHNELSGFIYDKEEMYQAENYDIEPMVDRVGGGDAFAAGLISALAEGQSSQKAIDFAVAASVLKHTIPGDVNLSSIEDVENLIEGKGKGKVKR